MTSEPIWVNLSCGGGLHTRVYCLAPSSDRGIGRGAIRREGPSQGMIRPNKVEEAGESPVQTFYKH